MAQKLPSAINYIRNRAVPAISKALADMPGFVNSLDASLGAVFVGCDSNDEVRDAYTSESTQRMLEEKCEGYPDIPPAKKAWACRLLTLASARDHMKNVGLLSTLYRIEQSAINTYKNPIGLTYEALKKKTDPEASAKRKRSPEDLRKSLSR